MFLSFNPNICFLAECEGIEFHSSTSGCGSGGIGGLTLHEGCKEDDRKHQAKGSDDDVADGKEVVTATHNVSSRHHEALVTAERGDIVELGSEFVDSDFNRVGALGEVDINPTKELAEVGQACSSHPDDEVL